VEAPTSKGLVAEWTALAVAKVPVGFDRRPQGTSLAVKRAQEEVKTSQRSRVIRVWSGNDPSGAVAVAAEVPRVAGGRREYRCPCQTYDSAARLKGWK